MALIDKTKSTSTTVPHSPATLNLSKEECEFLLETIQQSTFQGKDVAIVYDTVSKIEDYYVSLSGTK